MSRKYFFLLLSLLLFLTGRAQHIIKALPGDNISITIEILSSHLQWQQSSDGLTWTDAAGKTQATGNFVVSVFPSFFRGSVVEPNCEIRYSDTVKVEQIVLPEVSTNAAAGITSTSVITGGTIVSNGGSAIIEKGVVYGTASAPTLSNSEISKGNGNEPFIAAIESLTPSTVYHVRAFATNIAGTAYGQQIQFITSVVEEDVSLATVTTSTLTSINTSSATSGGNVTSDGGGSVTSRGIVFSTSSAPTLANNFVSSGTGVGSYASVMTGLASSTQYFVRAYASNNAGTAYGNQQSFTTSAAVALPGLSAVVISNLTKNSVSLSTTLTPAGNISAKGFVLGTNPAPTLANSQVVAGSGESTLTANVAGLASGIVYYVRAYSTNEAGTAYGAEVNFRTLDSNVILMFVPHEQTYYSEFIVMKKALEASGYTVEVRSSATGNSSTYMSPTGTTISATAATLPGGSHMQFTQQFQNLFGTAWDESLDSYPASLAVAGKIQDVVDMGAFRAMVVVGGLGALQYRVDGSYSEQGTATALEVEQAALKLNALALNALATGKPVMAQCHSASLPVFWRIPGTSGAGAESLGYSLLKGQPATGFPEPETPTTLQPFQVIHRATNITDGDRITIASPHASFEDNGLGDFKIITTRDWYPQTVAHAARTLLNILESYPTKQQITSAKTVLILHGGAINSLNCSAANRANDIPCNYSNAPADLPADYTDLQALLAVSPSDAYTFTVSQANIVSGSFPTDQQTILNYLNEFDVVIFFKHWSTGITPALLNAIVSYADNGGGVLALHHGLYNDLEGSQNKDGMINALFGAESAPWASLAEANRTTYRMFSTNYGHFISTYGLSLAPANFSRETPAPWSTTSLSSKANASFSYYHNFQLYDELYNNMAFKPGVIFGRNINEVTPMFSNDQSPSAQSHTSGFIKLFNQNGSDVGRVAYFQAGERKESLNQSHAFGQVVRNAIVWLSN
jgi:putative intracellular protease/amidase